MNRRKLVYIVAALLVCGGFGTPSSRAAFATPDRTFPQPPRSAHAALPASPAREPRPGELTLTTDRAVVFKDGYALIVKTAKGTTGPDGRVFTEEIPDAAVLGCFWATSTTHAIRSMNAEWVEDRTQRTDEGPCVSIPDLLLANKGKRVTLGVGLPQGTLTCRVVELLGRPVAPITTGEPFTHPRSALLSSTTSSVSSSGDLVAVDLDDGSRLVFPAAQVFTVSGSELTTTIARRTDTVTRAKRLTFQLAANSPPQSRPAAPAVTPGTPVTLQIFYFAPGIRWIPTYRVTAGATSSQPADIALQAEILNELEDLKSAKLDLIVGVPSFRFKDVISPLSLERELRSALANAAPQLMGQMANSMFSQRSSEHTARPGPPPPPSGESDLALAPELASGGAAEQDLFVYSLSDFTLARGARAAVPLWTVSAPSRDLYTLDLRLTRGRDGIDLSDDDQATPWNNRPQPASPLRLDTTRVWHQLELHNQSTTPWTTGAALLLRNGVPLGQDILAYTPVKSRTLLPVTVAVDMQNSYQEEEVSRTPNAAKWNGYNYALIRKRITLTVSNFRTESSDTLVKVSLGGKAENASDDATVRINDYRAADWSDGSYDYRYSNHSDLSWDFSLEPGATKTLTFEVTYYGR